MTAPLVDSSMERETILINPTRKRSPSWGKYQDGGVGGGIIGAMAVDQPTTTGSINNCHDVKRHFTACLARHETKGLCKTATEYLSVCQSFSMMDS